MARHPSEALYGGEKPFPILAACEHYAGSEKLMKKALELQAAQRGRFDVTFDLEDGAREGQEKEHAELAASLLTKQHGRVGVRIHARAHPHWMQDVDIVIAGAKDTLAYVTIPKARS